MTLRKPPLTAMLAPALGIGLALGGAAGALANDQNLLNDPGFERELAPEDGGWARFDKGWISIDQARTGSRSMFNNGYSRTVPYQPFFEGNVSGSYQEFPATAGSRWRLTGWGMASPALEGAPAFGIVQVSFFDADGNDLGTVETADSDSPPARTSNQVNGGSPVDEWIFLDTGVATAPPGTAVIQAFTLFVDYSGSNVAQGVYFDDLTLCALEEDDDGEGCR
jgi:hypothetical protein